MPTSLHHDAGMALAGHVRLVRAEVSVEAHVRGSRAVVPGCGPALDPARHVSGERHRPARRGEGRRLDRPRRRRGDAVTSRTSVSSAARGPRRYTHAHEGLPHAPTGLSRAPSPGIARAVLLPGQPRTVSPGEIASARGVFVDRDAWFSVGPGARLTIGDNAHINRGFVVSCAGHVSIGRNVVMADRVFVGDTNHGYEDVSTPDPASADVRLAAASSSRTIAGSGSTCACSAASRSGGTR